MMMKKNRLLAMVIIKLLSVVFITSCFEDKNTKSNLFDCQMTKIDAYNMLDSILADEKDSLTFSLVNLFSYDSIYIYAPYTLISTVENEHKCILAEGKEEVNENETLLVFKDNTRKEMFYSFVPRYYDLSSMNGRYSLKNLTKVKAVKRGKIFFFYW